VSFHPKDFDTIYISSDLEIFLYHFGRETVEPLGYQGRSSSIMWDFNRVIYFRPCWPHSSLCSMA
ncbi:hypothetical protein LINPERHAP2_LOCUS32683, partial [Linum perenne]